MSNSLFNSASVVSTPKIVAVLVFHGGEFGNLTEKYLPDLTFEPNSMAVGHCLKTSINILATAQTDRQTDTHTHTHIHPHQHIPTLHPTHVEAYGDVIFYFLFCGQSKMD
jgi:hypothetical protein